MSEAPMHLPTPALLVGGGPVDPADLSAMRERAPVIVATDGAADWLARHGVMPDIVIGDMDSIGDLAAWQASTAEVRVIAEQDTTDFEKCLYSLSAPFFIGLGFLGGRMDHTLAVFHALLRHPEKRVLLVSLDEAAMLVPAAETLRLDIAAGDRVSLFPLLPVTGTVSRGLTWPIEGLRMSPGRQIGTSNSASAPRVEIAFDGPGALLMLERKNLATLLAAFPPQTGH